MSVRTASPAPGPGTHSRLLALALLAALLPALAGPASSVRAAEDDAEAAGAAPAVHLYKLNYGLVYARDSRVLAHDPTAHREPQEAIFQLSFKTHVVAGLFLAYTQHSFWQVYDESASRPFRETNYNPEVFYTTPNFALGPALRLGVQAGAEHESNGRGIETIQGAPVLLSRSWNRYYAWPRLLIGPDAPLIVSFKWWGRVPEPAKTDPLDTTGDDNPDIMDYLGRGELHFMLGAVPWLRVVGMVRKGRRPGTGTVGLDVLLRPSATWHLWLQLHYFDGYGESLIDYNRSVHRLGIGVAVGDPARHFAQPLPAGD